MYQEGTIIYFTPFYFYGGASKNKYFLVLKNVNGQAVFASLPTSKVKIPNFLMRDEGCIEFPEGGLTSYVIPPNTPVTECGKSFRVKTFIYGYQLDVYSLDELEANYNIEHTDYEIFGQMKAEYFDAIIDCIKSSQTVSIKFIELLDE